MYRTLLYVCVYVGLFVIHGVYMLMCLFLFLFLCVSLLCFCLFVFVRVGEKILVIMRDNEHPNGPKGPKAPLDCLLNEQKYHYPHTHLKHRHKAKKGWKECERDDIGNVAKFKLTCVRDETLFGF